MNLSSFSHRSLGFALILAASFGITMSSARAATVVLGDGTYTENFNGITTGNNPVAGWDFRTSASASSLGTLNQVGATLRAWTHSTGQAKNVSSANIASTSTQAEQSTNTDRALGLRQVQAGGFDAGAALNFDFSSIGLEVQEIKLDLLMLDVASHSTTFEIQYGFGAAPSSFVTLGSWSDPGVFGSTTYTFDRADFGGALDGQSRAWFRIVALDPATGTGGYDMVAIDNFSVTSTSAVPEPSVVILGIVGMLFVLVVARCRRVVLS